MYLLHFLGENWDFCEFYERENRFDWVFHAVCVISRATILKLRRLQRDTILNSLDLLMPSQQKDFMSKHHGFGSNQGKYDLILAHCHPTLLLVSPWLKKCCRWELHFDNRCYPFTYKNPIFWRHYSLENVPLLEYMKLVLKNLSDATWKIANKHCFGVFQTTLNV